MRGRYLIRSTLALALLSIAPSALAQTKEPVETYHFDDDDLLADTWGAPPPLLRASGTGARRALLIRPRATFIAEMLKTVETL